MDDQPSRGPPTSRPATEQDKTILDQAGQGFSARRLERVQSQGRGLQQQGGECVGLFVSQDTALAENPAQIEGPGGGQDRLSLATDLPSQRATLTVELIAGERSLYQLRLGPLQGQSPLCPLDLELVQVVSGLLERDTKPRQLSAWCHFVSAAGNRSPDGRR